MLRAGRLAPGRGCGGVLALILANGRGRALEGLTAWQAKAAVPFGGQYRIVDFVLSRWPIESLGELDLSVRWREPRKAIVGAVTTPAGRIIVVAAHLGLLPFERRRQLARLKERIAAISERPIVVLGDFNDFPGRGLAERTLSPPLTSTPELATYPSRLPLLPLDRIWFSAPLELTTIATLRDASRVSDHLPLLASLCWPSTTPNVGTGFA